MIGLVVLKVIASIMCVAAVAGICLTLHHAFLER